MKIVIFTGAGISKRVELETFRDSVDGLWNNHRIDDVATKVLGVKIEQRF
jgi:NAD-dependent SIR2 family protein deacetylase